MAGATPEEMREIVRKRWAEYIVPPVKHCSRCKVEKSLEDFSPVRGQRYKSSLCKPCAAEVARQSRCTPESLNRIRAVGRTWHWRHRLQVLQKSRRQRDAVWDRLFALYGAVCVCCGEIDRVFLTVDHVNNDGKIDRAKFKDGTASLRLWLSRQPKLPNYRILCFNCNLGRARNAGVCPHELLMSKLIGAR